MTISKTTPFSGQFPHRIHRSKKGKQERAFTNHNSNKQYRKDKEKLIMNSMYE